MTKEVPRTFVLRDAELSISNATLISRLRSVWRYKDLHLCPEAADRIEALIAERDEAEAKLAKAVDGLKRVCRQPDYRLPSHQEIARATLAEIKSHSDEFATQKGESDE